MAIWVCTLMFISVILACVQFRVYSVLSDCIKRKQEGKSFVIIRTDRDIKGWVNDRDISAIQNHMRPVEEHIRISHKGKHDLVQIRQIREIVDIKSTVKVLVGNL